MQLAPRRRRCKTIHVLVSQVISLYMRGVCESQNGGGGLYIGCLSPNCQNKVLMKDDGFDKLIFRINFLKNTKGPQYIFIFHTRKIDEALNSL